MDWCAWSLPPPTLSKKFMAGPLLEIGFIELCIVQNIKSLGGERLGMTLALSRQLRHFDLNVKCIIQEGTFKA